MHDKEAEENIFNEILCAEYEAVYRYVLSLCRNENDAREVTQETFLKAMSNSGKFRSDSSLYTWLCTIAKNSWINRCRKRSREVPTEIPETLPAEDSLEQRVSDDDLSMQIHRVLHALKEPYKEVFSLRVFGQLSFANIAKLFSKTEGWARVTYYRAKKTITEALGKEGLL